MKVTDAMLNDPLQDLSAETRKALRALRAPTHPDMKPSAAEATALQAAARLVEDHDHYGSNAEALELQAEALRQRCKKLATALRISGPELTDLLDLAYFWGDSVGPFAALISCRKQVGGYLENCDLIRQEREAGAKARLTQAKNEAARMQRQVADGLTAEEAKTTSFLSRLTAVFSGDSTSDE